MQQMNVRDRVYTVPDELIISFRQKGHTLTPAIFSTEEISIWRKIISKAAITYNEEKRKLEDRDTYGKAFLQIMNLWEKDDRVREFVFSEYLAGIAAQLLGVSRVRLYHDQALYKEPGGGPTPWHQDQYYWPIDTHNTITLWMPLVDIDEDMGMLTFASGSHFDGKVFNKEISDESEELYRDYVIAKGYPVSRAKTMKAGDATWHYGHTIHFAPGNDSDKMREVMTVIYFADGARVTPPVNSFQENDLKKWMPGMKPGGIIQSPLNPLL